MYLLWINVQFIANLMSTYYIEAVFSCRWKGAYVHAYVTLSGYWPQALQGSTELKHMLMNGFIDKKRIKIELNQEEQVSACSSGAREEQQTVHKGPRTTRAQQRKYSGENTAILKEDLCGCFAER